MTSRPIRQLTSAILAKHWRSTRCHEIKHTKNTRATARLREQNAESLAWCSDYSQRTIIITFVEENHSFAINYLWFEFMVDVGYVSVFLWKCRIFSREVFFDSENILLSCLHFIRKEKALLSSFLNPNTALNLTINGSSTGKSPPLYRFHYSRERAAEAGVPWVFRSVGSAQTGGLEITLFLPNNAKHSLQYQQKYYTTRYELTLLGIAVFWRAMVILQILTTSLIHFFKVVGERYFLVQRSRRVKELKWASRWVSLTEPPDMKIQTEWASLNQLDLLTYLWGKLVMFWTNADPTLKIVASVQVSIFTASNSNSRSVCYTPFTPTLKPV